ncbi:MarR family winged helix-turn-helix transcriptional regulator [Actinospica robiniae]|uniref:MarR family winged helix-turn-helix transcriptional regulator n=1 Tax=Actinospica robiniae TaxID=304901 RepID=UPI0006888BA2|nr:MarR family transcriptional regulator [Actinospica robiniae]
MSSPRGRDAVRSAPAAPRLSYLVFRLERRIRGRLDQALARHGVTTTEYMVLSELRLRDGASSAQLARAAFVTPQAMNLVIRDLERRGLIRREADPHGGRVLSSTLSRAGKTLLRRCDRALDEIEDVMLADIDEEDRKVLADRLAHFAHALHAEPGAGQPSPPPRRDRPATAS